MIEDAHASKIAVYLANGNRLRQGLADDMHNERAHSFSIELLQPVPRPRPAKATPAPVQRSRARARSSRRTAKASKPASTADPEPSREAAEDAAVEGSRPDLGSANGTPPRRKPRRQLLIESDLPVAIHVAPWEHELLLPVVAQLLEAVFANVGSADEDE